MSDDDKAADRMERIKYLVVGALIGAALGALVKNIFLVSSAGMAIAVIASSRKESQEV